MSHFSKRWLWLAGFLVLVLALGAACGDDDDDDDDGGEATSPAATATEGGSPTATEADGGELMTDVGVSDTEIKLGLTIVQSGNLAAIYQPVFPALNAYFDYVNEEKGGICGREINLIVEDDQYSPAAGLEQAKKLVEQDQILAFVGNLGTPPVTGQVDYINEQEVPHLWVSTGAAKFGSGQYPWTIGYIPDYISDGGVQGAYIAENFPGATVATFSQNDDFGKDGVTGFKEGFGGAIAAEQTYESTATDINSQLAVLRDRKSTRLNSSHAD